MRKSSLIVSTVITAILSTICCVPAFLFLFFGVSVGSLSFLIEFDYLRIPFAILTFILLIVVYKKVKDQNSCKSKNIGFKTYITNLSISIVVLFFLFYPELLAYILE